MFVGGSQDAHFVIEATAYLEGRGGRCSRCLPPFGEVEYQLGGMAATAVMRDHSVIDGSSMFHKARHASGMGRCRLTTVTLGA